MKVVSDRARRTCAIAVAATMASSLIACDSSDAPRPAAAAKRSGETVSVPTDSVNYMHERGVQYTLYDLSRTPPAAVGGAIVYMLGSGGEKGCCLALPRTWRPGMMVRLDWQESDRGRTYPEKYSREMEIPRYSEPANLYVVFYPGHEVELVVSKAEPGHPEWRGSVKKTPWEQCVETHTRRPCFLALPKLFDARSEQGFCTYVTEERRPDARLNCLAAMQECMRDFEDQAFCHGILWGPRKKE